MFIMTTTVTEDTVQYKLQDESEQELIIFNLYSVIRWTSLQEMISCLHDQEV